MPSDDRGERQAPRHQASSLPGEASAGAEATAPNTFLRRHMDTGQSPGVNPSADDRGAASAQADGQATEDGAAGLVADEDLIGEWQAPSAPAEQVALLPPEERSALDLAAWFRQSNMGRGISEGDIDRLLRIISREDFKVPFKSNRDFRRYVDEVVQRDRAPPLDDDGLEGPHPVSMRSSACKYDVFMPRGCIQVGHNRCTD